MALCFQFIFFSLSIHAISIKFIQVFSSCIHLICFGFSSFNGSITLLWWSMQYNRTSFHKVSSSYVHIVYIVMCLIFCLNSLYFHVRHADINLCWKSMHFNLLFLHTLYKMHIILCTVMSCFLCGGNFDKTAYLHLI